MYMSCNFDHADTSGWTGLYELVVEEGIVSNNLFSPLLRLSFPRLSSHYLWIFLVTTACILYLDSSMVSRMLLISRTTTRWMKKLRRGPLSEEWSMKCHVYKKKWKKQIHYTIKWHFNIIYIFYVLYCIVFLLHVFNIMTKMVESVTLVYRNKTDNSISGRTRLDRYNSLATVVCNFFCSNYNLKK